MRTEILRKIVPQLLVLLLLHPWLQATTLARLSLDELASASDAVARLRCTNTESRWEGGSIWTVTTFNVVETLKGYLPATIEVRLPGGRVGHLTATVDGTPNFAPGAEVIAFLEKSCAGGFTVAGWVEGTFRISRDLRTNAEVVTQDSSAFAVFDATTRTFRAEGVRRMPLEEFHSRAVAAIAHREDRPR
jgi:hypothetical protein